MTHSAAAVRRVHCAAVPEAPHATWSNALVVGQEVVLSGQTAHPATQGGATMDAHAQALAVLRRIQALLEAAGGGLHNVTKLVVYVTDIALKDAVGRARREVFGDQALWPASTLVAVQALVFPELLVEIDAFARLDADLRQAA